MSLREAPTFSGMPDGSRIEHQPEIAKPQIDSLQQQALQILGHETSRRKLIQLAGLGLVSPVIGTIASACGDSGGPAPENPNPTATSSTGTDGTGGGAPASPDISLTATAGAGLEATAQAVAQQTAAAGQTETAEEPTNAPEVSPTPEPPKPISAAELMAIFGNLDEEGNVPLPPPTPEQGGTTEAPFTELLNYAQNNWQEDFSHSDIASEPMKAMKFLLSSIERTGIDQQPIDVSTMFEGLDRKFSRVTLKLPDEIDHVTLPNVRPTNLTFRRDAHMTVLGTLDGMNTIVAIDDFARRENSDDDPRMFLAIVPLASTGDPNIVSVEQLLSEYTENARYDSEKNAIIMNGDEESAAPVYRLEGFEEVVEEAGGYFIDIEPLKKNPDGSPILHKNPVIPEPTGNILFSMDHIEQSEDGRVLALDKAGNPIARAFFIPGKNEWRWMTHPEVLQRFTPREYIEALGKKLSAFSKIQMINDPNYVEAFNMVANESVDATFSADIVFQNFLEYDWRRILDNWATIEPLLDSSQIPQDFPYKWGPADKMLEFAKNHGMTVRVQHLLNGSNIPKTIYDREKDYSPYNAEELEKLAKFIIKTSVLRYPEIIDWEVSSEAASDILYNADKRFWYTRTASGVGIIDKAFIWTVEANPNARTSFVEDHVLEPDNDRQPVATKYLEFLRHFNEFNIPVHKAIIENNLWIGAPPQDEWATDILRQIVDLGYEPVSGETTISIADTDVWPDRKPTAQITDRLQAQASIMKMIAEKFLAAGGTVNLGGFTDRVSWLKETYPELQTDAMILDKDYNPKPAYYALLEVLIARLQAA